MISQNINNSINQVVLRDPIHVLNNEIGCKELVLFVFSQFDLQNTVSCNLVNKQWHHFAAPNIKDFDLVFEAAAKITTSWDQAYNKKFLFTIHRQPDAKKSLEKYYSHCISVYDKEQISLILTKYALDATHKEVLMSKRSTNETSFIDYDFLLEGEIKEDPTLLAKAISINSWLFDFIPKNLFEDLDFCLNLIPKLSDIHQFVYYLVKESVKNHPKFIAAVLTHYPKRIDCWQNKLEDAKFMQQALLINKSVRVDAFKNDESFWLEVIDQCKDLDALRYYKLKFGPKLFHNKNFMEKYEKALANLKPL